jgi:hypothetical protein
MDPWSVIMRAALSGQNAFQQALQWLAMMANSAIEIPAAVFQQFADLSGRFSLSIVQIMPLMTGILSSVWLRSLGRQELHTVVATLHLRLRSTIADDLKKEGSYSSSTCVFFHTMLYLL